jgi:hypothetical protein
MEDLSKRLGWLVVLLVGIFLAGGVWSMPLFSNGSVADVRGGDVCSMMECKYRLVCQDCNSNKKEACAKLWDGAICGRHDPYAKIYYCEGIVDDTCDLSIEWWPKSDRCLCDPIGGELQCTMYPRFLELCDETDKGHGPMACQ